MKKTIRKMAVITASLEVENRVKRVREIDIEFSAKALRMYNAEKITSEQFENAVIKITRIANELIEAIENNKINEVSIARKHYESTI